MTDLEISWRGLDAADYAHLDATAAWGAFVGEELVFVVTEGTSDADEFGEADELEDADPAEEPSAEEERVYSTWVVLTTEEDGMDGLEPLDGFESLQAAQDSLAHDLQDWQETRQQS